MWKVVQYGYATFGQGETQEAAKLDALQWLDDPDGVQGGGTMEWLEGELINTHNVTDGDLTLVYTTDSQ